MDWAGVKGRFGTWLTRWLDREEWLTDPVSGIPDLAAVRPQVEQWLEGGRAVGVVYFDIQAFGVLASVHGETFAYRVLQALGESLARAREELGGRAAGVRLGTPGDDDFFLFLCLPRGRGETAGSSQVARQVETFVKAAFRSRFIETARSDPPQLYTASTVLRAGPDSRPAQVVDDALAELRELARKERDEMAARARTCLKEILLGRQLFAIFQPIVDLRAGNVLGYEALIRGPAASPLHSPAELFQAARTTRLVIELESACVETIFTRAAELHIAQALFVNVGPAALREPLFRLRLRELLAGRSHPASVVLEVTESADMTRIPELEEVFSELGEKHVLLAIDDLGAGYANFLSVVQARPHYLKIDRSIIHGIHKSSSQQAVVQSLVQLARQIGARLIAEGIEEAEELRTVLRLGVDYAQGYFLGRPAPEPGSLEAGVKAVLAEAVRHKELPGDLDDSFSLQEILSPGWTVQVSTPVSQVIHTFETEKRLTSVVVLDGDRPVGLIQKDKLFNRLVRPHLQALYSRRTVEVVMDRRFATVHVRDTLAHVSKVAVTRSPGNQYDDLVVVNDQGYVGTIPMSKLLEMLTNQQIALARKANPLTGLPGNLAIKDELKKRLQEANLLFIYVDLDHFKQVNDAYGFEVGDAVIQALARALQRAATSAPPPPPFVGHVGGDDFVAICRTEQGEPFLHALLAEWETESRQARDSMAALGRQLRRASDQPDHPVTISVAVVTNREGFTSTEQLAMKAAQVKREAKGRPGNAVVWG